MFKYLEVNIKTMSNARPFSFQARADMENVNNTSGFGATGESLIARLLIGRHHFYHFSRNCTDVVF